MITIDVDFLFSGFSLFFLLENIQKKKKKSNEKCTGKMLLKLSKVILY